ncbi:helix-turn-helix domain-containing protein [Paenibacillus tianmuensis]|nr:helix-turn-helix domain-containing protein [Paenibacillus tianmuensis]
MSFKGLFKLCDTFQCTLSELIEYEPEDKKEA